MDDKLTMFISKTMNLLIFPWKLRLDLMQKISNELNCLSYGNYGLFAGNQSYIIEIIMKLRIFSKIILFIALVSCANTIIAKNNYRLLKTYFQQPIHPTLQLPSMQKVTQPLVVEQASDYKPLSNQQFDNTVTLENIMLKQPIEITASRFNQKVLFSDIKYRKDVNVDLSTFNDDWQQRQSKAYKSFKLYAVTFNGKTNFVRNIVRGNMAANQCHFNAPVKFTYNRFELPISFDNNMFNETASFNHSRFRNTTSFQNSIFKKSATFVGSEFDGPITNFSNVHFMMGADFSNSIINGDLNFENVSSPNKVIDLTKMRALSHGEKIGINLINADISHIKINYTTFQLIFPKHTLAHIKIHTYNQLLNQFKKNGLQKSYNQLHIEYQRFLYRNNNQPIMHFLDKHWWGYGIERSKPYQWILAFLCVFTAINTVLINSLDSSFQEIEFIAENSIISSKKINIIYRLLYSIPFSLVATLYIILGGFLHITFKTSGFTGRNLMYSLYLILHPIFGFTSILFMVEHLISR